MVSRDAPGSLERPLCSNDASTLCGHGLNCLSGTTSVWLPASKTNWAQPLFGTDRMQDKGELQNQRSGRVRRLQVSRLGFVLLVATVLSLINAGSVLQRTSSFSGASTGIFALQTVTEVALLWCTMAALVLLAAFNVRILKVWTLILVGLGFISSYYVLRLNVGIDMSVIRSILTTDQKEVAEFVDPLSLSAACRRCRHDHSGTCDNPHCPRRPGDREDWFWRLG